jgi:hypothetical protein
VVAGLLGRKADAFAALLDGKAPAGGAASDPSLAHLGQLVQRLSNVPQPSAAFRSSLRDQLVSAASHPATSAFQAIPQQAAGGSGTATAPSTGTAGSGAGTGATGAAGGTGASGIAGFSSTLSSLAKSAPLWTKLFIAGTAVAVSGTGVGIGAHRALPGDLFYGVKQQVEAVQLDLASGARDKATTQLGFAHARADELKELIKRDGVTPGKPLSGDTAAHIRELLQNWAENAGEGTTSLIKQIRALGTSPANAKLSAQLRKTLSDFTTQQFSQIGSTLASLPTGSVQSLTVSALGYLQRVDRALGGNPTALTEQLTKQLPIPLSSIPGIANLDTILNLPVGSGTQNGSPGKTLPVPLPTGGAHPVSPGGQASHPVVQPSPLPSLRLPTHIPSLLPSGGPGGLSLPTGVLPSSNILPSLGNILGNGGSTNGTSSGSNVGGLQGSLSNTVGGVTNSLGAVVGGAGQAVTGGVGGTVGGTVGSVTGGLTSVSGPSLPLPTAVATLPALPKTLGLGG